VFDQPANIGDGTKDELKLELSIPFDRLGLSGATLRGDVTKRWSSVTDPTTREKREISALRPIEWNANFTQDLPRLHLSYGVDAFSAWRETNYRFNLVETTKLKTFVEPFLEYRPQPQWNIRFEIRNLTNRGLRRTVSVYPGPRDRGGVPDIEDRDYQPGRMYYVRIRRTFGG
jgi:outer membrane receptor protein involved in Fe transport